MKIHRPSIPVFAMVFMFLLLPAIATAAEPASQKKTKQEVKETITLSGVVVDTQDKPAQGVQVFIEWLNPEQDRAETKTDKQGHFTLDVPVQSIRFQVVQAVRFSKQQMAHYALPWKIEQDDPSLKKIRLQLRPSKRIELQAVDSDGKPIANAKTGIIGDYRVWGTRETNNQGQAVYHVSHDVKIKYLFAFSNGHGAAYITYDLPRGQAGDKITKPPALPDHPIQLKLDPMIKQPRFRFTLWEKW